MNRFVLWDDLTQRLSLVVRVIDRFTDLPVPQALRVWLDPGGLSPCPSATGTRHPDGTYRFVNVASGPVTVCVADDTGSWLPEPNVGVMLPLPDPTVVHVRAARPTPRASAPSGGTWVRGRLLNSAAAPVSAAVAVHRPADPPGLTVQSDGAGEFVFPIVGFHPTTGGEVPLVLSGPTVLSWRVPGGSSTAGSAFAVPPGRDTRVIFTVAP